MDKKNFVTRLISALILGPLALYAVYLGSYYFFLLVALISWFSVFELSRMFNQQEAHANNWLLYLYVPVNHFFMMMMEFDLVFISFLAFGIIQYFIELFRNKGKENLNNAFSNFITIYAVIFPSAMLAIREMTPSLFDMTYTDASAFIFLILIAVWACDTFAYIGGVNFGKHKLFPRVSPKKSYEGAIFGFAGAVITAYVFHLTSLSSLEFSLVMTIGVIIGVFGQIGDLIESLIKRNAGVKDSGETIPGHGGVLDRIDSIIFVSPIIFLVLFYLNS